MLTLREELDLVREENRQLRERLGLDVATERMIQMRQVLKIQPQCLRLLHMLMCVPLGRKEHLFEAMTPTWASSDNEIKNVDVRICTLRRALRPHGIEIETVWGVGYRLSPEMKARLRTLFQFDEAEAA